MISKKLDKSLREFGEQLAIEDSSGEWVISYSELDAATRQFGDAFCRQASVLVLYLDKGPDYYVAAAACFRFGIDFCPVDVLNPPDRLLEIASQFDNATIITDSEQRFEQISAQHSAVAKVPSEYLKVTNDRHPVSAMKAGRYFIATSGSTGRPKVVCVPHDNTLDFVAWSIPFYQVDATTRWAQFSSTGFDLSIVDLLTVLCGGGTLVAIIGRLDRSRPGKTIAKRSITHWHSVPSVIPYLLADETDGADCRLFTFCGEPLSVVEATALSHRFPQARIVNTYGPTEGTLFCSYYEYDRRVPLQGGGVPVGRAIPGWNFVLLQDETALRLVIASNNVADGYLGDNSPRFGKVDFFGTPMRTFDSGDYFRVEGGELVFSHRRDGMVKVSGNRVDLGEVETAAKRIGLQNAVAFLVGGKIVLCSEGTAPPPEHEIRTALGAMLPGYAIPSRFLFNDLHPRTESGKVSRKEIAKMHRLEGPGE